MKRLFFGILFLCLLLTGCGEGRYEIKDAPHPLEELRAQYLPEQEQLPEIEKIPAYAGDPDPVPGTLADAKLVVDGKPVKTPLYLVEDNLYVSLERVAIALDAAPEVAPDQLTFTWDGQEICMVRAMENYFYGESIRNLGTAVPICIEEGLLVPVQQLCDILQIGFFRDVEENTFYITPGAGKFSIPSGVRIPVLMYHAVGDDVWGDTELFVSTSDMEAQLAWLADNGYTTIFFEDLAHADEIEKPVLLTFDDGYRNNYEELFPLLQKYNSKATIFIVTDLVDQADHKMTSEQIKEMSSSGLVSIQSHTGSHPHLKQLSAQAQREELLRSKLALLRITGREPYALCYPYGEYNTDTLNQMSGLYTVATKIGNLDYFTGQDRRTIARWYMKRSTTMEEFIAMIEP